MLRVAQMVRAPGCGPGGRRFETGHAPHGFLAQLVERQTEDLRVPGPIPGEPTIYGRMPESGQKGRTVNSLPQGYVGSNPTSPTIIAEAASPYLGRPLFKVLQQECLLFSGVFPAYQRGAGQLYKGTQK